ncbi:hypothetical protein IW261DRAFT_1459899 [Armillaria novae-zelandiae]|uniref:Secreted protein n=1 Tax=Armillaria novae-zelandiae TaxID=153914 RepID=A0AA39PJS0_9AGAR|nr:hypothetical protein IW261DRAFT_1459899 [Armillaria novae-zelandiae]
MAEYFSRNRTPSTLCSLLLFSFVITTGHMSGGHLSETLWMKERPDPLKNAVAAVVYEHLWSDRMERQHGSSITHRLGS